MLVILWLGLQVLQPTKVAASAYSGCTSMEGIHCLLPFNYQGKTFYECWTHSPGFGDEAFGRCPIKFENETSREASSKDEDWQRCGPKCPLQAYTSNSMMETKLSRLALEKPELLRLFNVGNSNRGQKMLGVQITRGVRQPRQLLKPKVRYIGNMHGNEPVGRELLLHLAERLVISYGKDPELTQLLDNTDITLIPTINPDGFDRATEGQCSGDNYAAGRYNEGKKDLNRNFPTWRQLDLGNITDDDMDREPETKAIMKLIQAEPWVLSANFHGGAVVASYPWDDYRQPGAVSGIAATPDHDIFQHLALVYAENHLTMQNLTHSKRWHFKDGITNGAEWYALSGGMQDYNYLVSNNMEITLEVSWCKYPKPYFLNQLWDENRASLIKYIQEVHRGVKGVVRDAEGQAVENATIVVINADSLPRSKNITTSAQGEYWRILLPGNYSIRAVKGECQTRGIRFVSDLQQVELTEERPLAVLHFKLFRQENCTASFAAKSKPR